MRADEIMTSPVVCVDVEASVHDAAALMTSHGITSLPVLDDDDRVIGIVSEADLIRDRMPRDPRSHLRPELQPQPDPAQSVGDVMTDTVVCLGPAADSADIATLMLDNAVRAVPIVDGRRLLGIVSRRDLLRTLLRPDAETVSDVTERLDRYAGEPGRWKVTVADNVVSIGGRFDDAAQKRIVTSLAQTVPGVLRVHTNSHAWH